MVSLRLLAVVALLGLVAAPATILPVSAEDAIPDPEASTGDPALDALLAKEKEGRKACKAQICGIIRSKKAEGADVTCNVVQTWPKQSLDQLLSKAKVTWPMGNALCKTDLKINRAMLAKAMSEPKFEAQFEALNVECDIAAKDGKGEPTRVTLSIKPKVTFENGVATKAAFNWGAVEAPALVKGVLWPTVTLDNNLGLFGGTFVKMINRFTTAKCDEVKDLLPAN